MFSPRRSFGSAHHASEAVVARGAEQRSRGLSAALGGWQLEPPPPSRRDGGAARLISLLALLTAVGVALAAVFVTRPDSPTPTQPTAATATLTDSAAGTVPPPITASRPDTTEAAPGAQPAFRSSQTTAAAAPTAAAQSSISQSAIEAAAGAEQRAVVIATSDEAEQQIRAYIGYKPTDMLPPAFSYTVEVGDTVSTIAARFGLQEATIRFNNFDIYDPDMLEVGASLQLPVRDGVIYVVQSGDTLDSVLQNYAAELDATLDFPGNGIASADYITVGQKLLLVGGSASLAAGSYEGSGGAASWSMPVFGWPMKVDAISDAFGVPRNNAYGYHTGVDWPAPIGRIVGATAAGVVSYAGWDAGYGYWVEVDHGGGVRSRYAHLNEISVVSSQWLEAGQYVGTVGNTGQSSGPHLHFEIIMSGQPVNPYEWLQ